MVKLNDNQIAERLKILNGWQRDGDQIVKEWHFKDFISAMAFIQQVALLCEKNNHHPEMFNVYNRVQLTFSTHDAGGLTENDFRIAAAIDQLG